MKFTAPAEGRKGAYYQRNRQSLIAAAQKVLAEKGPEATLEDVAQAADMAVSTIYKHFSGREQLVEAALVEAMKEFERDVFATFSEADEPLKQLVAPMKALLKLKDTHPHFAQLVIKNREVAFRISPIITANLKLHVKRLTKSGDLKIDNPELRTRNVISCLAAAFEDHLMNPRSSELDNLSSISIALGMLGIDESVSAKLLKH